MQKDDLVYVGHMLDMARKAIGKVQGLTRATYDADEDLRLAGRGRSLPGFEADIAATACGYPLGWHDLLSIARKLFQTIDATIVGYRGDLRIPRTAPRQELIRAYEVVIEAVDSSIWVVASQDEGLLDRYSARFSSTERVAHD